jgi:hypothetical protein
VSREGPVEFSKVVAAIAGFLERERTRFAIVGALNLERGLPTTDEDVRPRRTSRSRCSSSPDGD